MEINRRTAASPSVTEVSRRPHHFETLSHKKKNKKQNKNKKNYLWQPRYSRVFWAENFYDKLLWDLFDGLLKYPRTIKGQTLNRERFRTIR